MTRRKFMFNTRYKNPLRPDKPEAPKPSKSISDLLPRGDGGTDEPEQGSIEDNPKAMSLVEQLKQMGFTGEDVERAMSEGEPEGGEGSGQDAVKAATMGLPGQ
jgi:hypothetical protein